MIIFRGWLPGSHKFHNVLGHNKNFSGKKSGMEKEKMAHPAKAVQYPFWLGLRLDVGPILEDSGHGQAFKTLIQMPLTSLHANNEDKTTLIFTNYNLGIRTKTLKEA